MVFDNIAANVLSDSILYMDCSLLLQIHLLELSLLLYKNTKVSWSEVSVKQISFLGTNGL